MNGKLFSYDSGKGGKFLKIFGLTLALNPWGNCFSPAICLDNTNFKAKPFNWHGKVCHPSRLQLVFRSNFLDTTIHWRGGLRFDWNSAHLARRFGTFVDSDFGGYFQWRGHMDL